MIAELERIQRLRQEQLQQIQTKEDKQQRAASDNADSLQAKENSYKEEFLKQLKLADRRGPSPTTTVLGLSQPDHRLQQRSEATMQSVATLGEEDRLKFQRAQQSVGVFLEELTEEQSEFNYSQGQTAEKLTHSVAAEMKAFCKQLVEKKLNQPRDLHDLPPSGLALTLGAANGKRLSHS